MPVSYFFLVFSFGAWVVAALAIAVVLSAVVAVQLGSPWPSVAWLGLALLCTVAALVALRTVLAIAGFFTAVWLLWRPHYTSGQAWGFIDTASGAPVLIFTGSVRHGGGLCDDNILINGVVWPRFGPMRHRGFHRAWSQLRPGVEQWLRGLDQPAPLILTGHSLGGALAQIAASDLSERGIGVSHVVAFGSSRIGGRGMRALYKKQANPADGLLHAVTRQIRRTSDSIPRLPPALWFKHVGQGFALSPMLALIEVDQRPIALDYVQHTARIVIWIARWFNARAAALKARVLGGPPPPVYAAPMMRGSFAQSVGERITLAWQPEVTLADRAQRLSNTLVSFPQLAALFTVKLLLIPLAALAVSIVMAGHYYVRVLRREG